MCKHLGWGSASPFFVFLTKKPPKFAYIKYFLYLCSRKGSYERITNIHTGF